jgi:hypothetical protein
MASSDVGDRQEIAAQLEATRVKDVARQEEERVRIAKRALECKEERERETKRKKLRKPRTQDEERLHKMRLEYKRMGIKVDF